MDPCQKSFAANIASFWTSCQTHPLSQPPHCDHGSYTKKTSKSILHLYITPYSTMSSTCAMRLLLHRPIFLDSQMLLRRDPERHSYRGYVCILPTRNSQLPFIPPHCQIRSHHSPRSLHRPPSLTTNSQHLRPKPRSLHHRYRRRSLRQRSPRYQHQRLAHG